LDRLVSCLTVEHTPTAFFASVAVALIGGYLTVSLSQRIRNAPVVSSQIWLLLAGFVGGVSVWCAHFIAMLGYQVAQPHAYDPVLTFVSLGLVVVTATAGIFVGAYARRGPLLEAGGVVMGLGVGLMHFVGMAGFQASGAAVWSVWSILLSLVLGGFFGALCFTTAVRLPLRVRTFVAAFFFLLAVVSVHYISLAGLTIVPNGSAAEPFSGLQRQTMIFFTAQGTSLVFVLGFALLVLDVRNRQSLNDQVFNARAHDALTGLPNRWALGVELDKAVEDAESRGGQLALLLLDVERFKEINDVHGHSAGDYVLSAVASRLSSSAGLSGFLARAGNDEFAIILRYYTHRSETVRLMRRIAHELERPVEWRGLQFSIQVSAGVSVFPANGRAADQLIARAEAALQRAKRKGSGTAFYKSELDRGARRRNELALDLRRALSDGEFRLFYQQQHMIDSQEVFGFEVLLRWFHKEYGFIGPDEFIPLAERTGFIDTLGEWLLREACADAVNWKNPLQVGVNVAPQQLADYRFPEKVAAILEGTGLPPERLELEITESGFIDDFNRTFEAIRALKALGVKIAMDDFGTGYSSLSMLQQFPFDKIKIDRSFVQGLPENDLSAAIVRSTLMISKSLGIRVLAEGVETEEQLRFLLQEQCTRAQGFYFGKPVPRVEIEDYVSGPCPPSERCCTPIKIEPGDSGRA